MPLRDEVIVCTRNRPGDLRRCLESLATQHRPPAQIRIVDSSDDDATRTLALTWRQSPPLVYQRSAPGLTRQRNAGVAAGDSDIVHFLDDDVECEPGYIEGIMAAFEHDGRGNILGVGGLVTNSRPPEVPALKRALGLSTARQGVVLASGRNTVVHDIDAVTEVDWLSGCSMSYRRDVFAADVFDESLVGYGLGEDLDFSYRVRQRGRLVVTPSARLEHHQSAVNRLDDVEYTIDEIVLRAKRVRTRVGVLRMRAFWLSIAGQAGALLVDGVVSGRAASRRRLRATLRAGWQVLRERSS